MHFVPKYIAVNLLCSAKEKEGSKVVAGEGGLARWSFEGVGRQEIDFQTGSPFKAHSYLAFTLHLKANFQYRNTPL